MFSSSPIYNSHRWCYKTLSGCRSPSDVPLLAEIVFISPNLYYNKFLLNISKLLARRLRFHSCLPRLKCLMLCLSYPFRLVSVFIFKLTAGTFHAFLFCSLLCLSPAWKKNCVMQTSYNSSHLAFGGIPMWSEQPWKLNQSHLDNLLFRVILPLKNKRLTRWIGIIL